MVALAEMPLIAVDPSSKDAAVVVICRYCGRPASECVPFQRCDAAREVLASCELCGATCRDPDGRDLRTCCAFCLKNVCRECSAHNH